MISPPSPVLPSDVHRTRDGWWVIPRILPMWVPDTALSLSVAEWLDLKEDA